MENSIWWAPIPAEMATPRKYDVLQRKELSQVWDDADVSSREKVMEIEVVQVMFELIKLFSKRYDIEANDNDCCQWLVDNLRVFDLNKITEHMKDCFIKCLSDNENTPDIELTHLILDLSKSYMDPNYKCGDVVALNYYLVALPPINKKSLTGCTLKYNNADCFWGVTGKGREQYLSEIYLTNIINKSGYVAVMFSWAVCNLATKRLAAVGVRNSHFTDEILFHNVDYFVKLAAEADQERLAGNHNVRQKSYQKAISCYTRALAISPCGDSNKVAFYSNRAFCRIQLYTASKRSKTDSKNLRWSLADCESALLYNPLHEKALYRKAQIHDLLKEYTQAVEDYAKLLAAHPENSEGIQNINRVIGEQSIQEDVKRLSNMWDADMAEKRRKQSSSGGKKKKKGQNRNNHHQFSQSLLDAIVAGNSLVWTFLSTAGKRIQLVVEKETRLVEEKEAAIRRKNEEKHEKKEKERLEEERRREKREKEAFEAAEREQRRIELERKRRDQEREDRKRKEEEAKRQREQERLKKEKEKREKAKKEKERREREREEGRKKKEEEELLKRKKEEAEKKKKAVEKKEAEKKRLEAERKEKDRERERAKEEEKKRERERQKKEKEQKEKAAHAKAEKAKQEEEQKKKQQEEVSARKMIEKLEEKRKQQREALVGTEASPWDPFSGKDIQPPIYRGPHPHQHQFPHHHHHHQIFIPHYPHHHHHQHLHSHHHHHHHHHHSHHHFHHNSQWHGGQPPPGAAAPGFGASYRRTRRQSSSNIHYPKNGSIISSVRKDKKSPPSTPDKTTLSGGTISPSEDVSMTELVNGVLSEQVCINIIVVRVLCC